MIPLSWEIFIFRESYTIILLFPAVTKVWLIHEGPDNNVSQHIILLRTSDN